MKRLLTFSCLLAIAWSAFQIYTAVFGFYPAQIQRPIHVGFALALTFLLYPLFGKPKDPEMDAGFSWKVNWNKSGTLDFIFALICLGGVAYILWNAPRFSSRVWFVDPLIPADIIIAFILVALLIEACRRIVGLALPIVAIVFILYQVLGPYIPGDLAHRGISLTRFADLQIFSLEGVFGTPTGVSANYVFYFILLAAFLEASGGALIFTDLAFRLTGRTTGGPAKASVVASGLFGMISGSAVANVVVDGVYTIPMMMRTGFRAPFAAAVEAVASTGGQIMPPVMGAAAFILAEITGIPYSKVIIHAAIPAVAYYVALFFMVHLEAKRLGLKPLTKEELPALGDLFSRIHLLFPLIFLTYLILADYTLMFAAFWSMVVVVILSWVRRQTRMGLTSILTAMRNAARAALAVAIPCAVAGVIVGVVVFSGLGLKITSVLIALSGGNLILGLFLVMFTCIILGMGMPTSAAYILGASLMAPALIRMGVAPIAAHLFVFYFACISMITPPVALAAYAAAGIAKSDLWETGWQAFFLGIAGFLVPFAFVFNQALLISGPISEIIWTCGTLMVGVFALATSVVGYFRRAALVWERVSLFAAACLLITPEFYTDLIGFAILIGIFFIQSRQPQGVREAPAK
jgi:TRAP transporter 4TM/12TM fusion protein